MSQEMTERTDDNMGNLEKTSRLEGAVSTLNIEEGDLGNLRIGPIHLKLATTDAEIEAAQALRYKIFYLESGAPIPADVAATELDADSMDEHCDHLLVMDDRLGLGPESVVGTYRLIRREAAQSHGRFYSSSEFDISKLIAYPGNILELGRSCVDVEYRTRPVMQMLWKGIASYMFHYNLDLLFGCASLSGTDLEKHKEVLAYLYHHHLAPENLRAKTLPQFYVDMNAMPKESIDVRRALRDMAPLVKGYIRIGAYIGDGAFVDHALKTTDVCIILPTKNITDKYFKHYQRSTRAAWSEE
jgi:putative hemolysin